MKSYKKVKRAKRKVEEAHQEMANIVSIDYSKPIFAGQSQRKHLQDANEKVERRLAKYRAALEAHKKEVELKISAL